MVVVSMSQNPEIPMHICPLLSKLIVTLTCLLTNTSPAYVYTFIKSLFRPRLKNIMPVFQQLPPRRRTHKVYHRRTRNQKHEREFHILEWKVDHGTSYRSPLRPMAASSTPTTRSRTRTNDRESPSSYCSSSGTGTTTRPNSTTHRRRSLGEQLLQLDCDGDGHCDFLHVCLCGNCCRCWNGSPDGTHQ
jgi:hypothetical protein